MGVCKNMELHVEMWNKSQPKTLRTRGLALRKVQNHANLDIWSSNLKQNEWPGLVMYYPSAMSSGFCFRVLRYIHTYRADKCPTPTTRSARVTMTFCLILEALTGTKKMSSHAVDHFLYKIFFTGSTYNYISFQKETKIHIVSSQNLNISKVYQLQWTVRSRLVWSEWQVKSSHIKLKLYVYIRAVELTR